MQAETLAIRRVVIGFDPAPADVGALRVAAGLAAGLGAELVGLYVEDERLLRLAEHPFAREFGVHSARSRPMLPEDVARSLRAQAERVRRLMARTADPLNLAWTLEIVRGELPRSALAATTLADLLVVAGRHLFAPTAPASGPVVVLVEDSDAGRRALSLAQMLQRVSGTGLLVLADGQDEQRLKRVILMQRPSAIILPRGSADAAERMSRAQLSCPLVLVG
jgi:nucleotide-binding universal stress UspA family protein